MFTATQWHYKPSLRELPIMIEACWQRDGSTLYAVRQIGECLNKSGEWEYEPMPSSRDEEFMARCRFETWEDAAGAIHKYADNGKGRFQ